MGRWACDDSRSERGMEAIGKMAALLVSWKRRLTDLAGVRLYVRGCGFEVGMASIRY